VTTKKNLLAAGAFVLAALVVWVAVMAFLIPRARADTALPQVNAYTAGHTATAEPIAMCQIEDVQMQACDMLGGLPTELIAQPGGTMQISLPRDVAEGVLEISATAGVGEQVEVASQQEGFAQFVPAEVVRKDDSTAISITTTPQQQLIEVLLAKRVQVAGGEWRRLVWVYSAYTPEAAFERAAAS
jgi:hypothetical protein